MLRTLDKLITPIKHHLLTVSFVAGFVVDSYTLSRVDKLFDNAVLATYVVVSMLGIIYLYFGTSGKRTERFQSIAAKWAPVIIQYAFGGLMSGILVFYSRSGSWWTSWPFLILIFGVILGNEFIKKRAQRLVFNLTIFFIGLFAYAALIVPVVLGRMGDIVFVCSGILALVIFILFTRVLYAIVPNFMALNTRFVFFSIGMAYVLLNTLYFTNLIPPIPLSMKDMGIYHSVVELSTESGGSKRYQLSYEQGPWYAPWRQSDSTYHYKQGDRVYCYASVFAPSGLTTNIVHTWEFYDTAKGRWILHEKIPYAIVGERGGGYRGYSFIESVQDGAWRCSVETPRGQVIGRATFGVITGTVPRTLVSRVDL